MQKRKRLYNVAKSSGSQEAWSNYRKTRNEITKEINEAHKVYQEKLFDCDTNSGHKSFWKYIKSLRRDNTGVAPLKHGSSLTRDPHDKAKILNNQFFSVFTHEDLSDLSQCIDPTFPLAPDIAFSTDGILKLIKSLNINKASGPDNISARALVLCAEEIAPVLTVLFTQSFDSGKLPNDWLTANITPVFKKGDKINPKNYRPISLTSLCCKLMEHIICHNIMNHLESNHILNDYQYGFRPSHSCQAQLISIVEELQLALDCHQQVDLIMLDFSKAFDTVPHQHLLKKLSFYGIDGKLHHWLSTWLTKRSQRVVVDGCESEYVSVLSGIPQGTVLGPVMFLLYINDINNNVSSSLRLFADDCIIYRTIKSEQDHLQLQQDLHTVNEWSQRWQMCFNISKCVVLRCHRILSPSLFTYTLNEQSIFCIDQHSYLGVTLTSNMSFSPHIQKISAKATRMLNFIRRNLYNCSKEIKSRAYLTLVRPILEYASPVWDPHLVKDRDQIEKVQRAAARWVSSDYRWSSSVTSMLNLLSWPTLHLRRKISKLQIFYKAIHTLTALPIPDYFNHVTRFTRNYHSLHYILPSSNSDSYKFSFFPSTIQAWNNLPTSVTESDSMQLFITNLNQFYSCTC